MDFQRARSEEQRQQRRETILRTTAAMLGEMSATELSLNELSRRVGLAKSNVLRYFESREAILLELLDGEVSDWTHELERTPVPAADSAVARGNRLAELMATTLAARPVLCDLLAAQGSVLERNVSTEVVLRHKRSAGTVVQRLAAVTTAWVPELSRDAATQAIAIGLIIAGGAWPASQPTEAVCAAYDAEPAVAGMRMDFAELVTQTVALTISGLLVRESAAAATT